MVQLVEDDHMVCFHGWIPESKDKLKIMVRALGQITCAHFSSLYPTPLGPGADESVVVRSVLVILSGEIGGHFHLGSARGSPGWEGETCRGLSRKKRCLRMSVFWVGSSTS